MMAQETVVKWIEITQELIESLEKSIAVPYIQDREYLEKSLQEARIQIRTLWAVVEN